MCGVAPRPVNTQPLQDKVASSVNQCQQNNQQQEIDSLKSRVSTLEQQVQDIYSSFNKGANLNQNLANNCAVAPQAACLPPPNVTLANAPAGKGLETNPAGWPANSVRTAGGYTVVPEGKDAAWSIFGPNQSPGDKPLTRIWGDPHVDEADGQRWDFTKSSNFRLPDGTLIDAKTTSETGQSVSSSLNIINGSDRVQISGIDKNKPQLSEVTRDGFQYRAQLPQNRDTFVMGGTGNNKDGNDRVQWGRERNGVLEGVIGGTKANFDGKGSYDQVIDGNRKFTIDSSLQPDPRTNPEAWGNQFRGEVVDTAARLFQGESSFLRDYIASSAQLGDSQQRFIGGLQKELERIFSSIGGNAPAGGWSGTGGCFNGLFANPSQGFNGAEDMFSQLLRQWELSSIFKATSNQARTMFV